MKKLTSKLKRSKKSEKPSRITNETVAEHRERILAGGRRFKYPVQYTKHRLVWTAIAIGFVVLSLFLAVSWWQLYQARTTDAFYYRVTRIVPLPVAQVDGSYVRYGDYLLNYKKAETYLNTAEKANEAQYAGGAGSQSIYDYHKAQAMTDAVTDTYAQKLADDYGITISDQQIDDAFALTRKLSNGTQISQEVVDRSNEQFFGLTPSDSRYLMKKSLLRNAVSYQVDDSAKRISTDIESALKQDSTASFDVIVEQYNKRSANSVQVATTGWVKKTSPDGGITEAAAKLEKGQVSGPIKPAKGDGYYFIRLIDTNDQDEINYQFIKVSLKEFKQQVDDLKQSGKVTYYITVPEVQSQVQTN